MALTTVTPLHVFCRVLELASFRQAADSLHMPIATVSNQVRLLERHLGVQLLRRSSRHVEATDEGLAHYRRVLPLLEGLDEAEQLLRDTQLRPAGRLHVSLAASVARLVIAPSLADFQSRYPDISLRLVATDQVVDMAVEGLDCAIRTSEPVGSIAETSPITRVPQYFAASPCLVQRLGEPRSLEQLAALPFINYAGVRDGVTLQVQAIAAKTTAAAQRRVQFSVQAPVSVDDGSAYVALAVAGLGVIQSPAYDLNPELAAGRLQLLLPEWQGPDIAFHALYARGRLELPRVKVFMQWASALLLKPDFFLPITIKHSL